MKTQSDTIKILLVDDDEDDFVQIRDLLNEVRETKFQLEWASSYQNGMQSLESGLFDVCLLDYRLGAQTGLEFLREAQQLRSKCPIVLLTGHADIAVDLAALETGAADFLVKGELTPMMLARSIRYTIKQAFDLHTLQEQTDNFETLFNSTFEGIIVHEAGEIVDANAASGKIFGSLSSGLIGSRVSRFFSSGNDETFNQNILASLEKGQQLNGVRCNLEHFPAEILTRAVSLNGRSVLLTTVQDLTSRKELEAQLLQQDRLTSLGLLASSLAHEIGTPMAVIRGRAELLLDESSGPSAKNLNLIISQIDGITKLMQSVLQLARGKPTGSVTEVDLVSVVNDVLQLLNHEFKQKNILVEMLIKGKPSVRAEAGPLGQVLLNLLVNSIHAIDEKEKTAANGAADRKITISSRKTNDDRLEINVADTGCGIAKENLSSLYKPFFTTKEIGTGTGLGLAISFRIIDSWNGTIAAESEVGRGTSFKIDLRT